LERPVATGWPPAVIRAVTDLARKLIAPTVHASGTARVQTLAPEQNPFLAEVFGCFAALTGVPVLINTSLNVKGKLGGVDPPAAGQDRTPGPPPAVRDH